MARIWNGIIKNALVVENPDPSLDGLLEAKGMSVRRLATTPDEAGLIAEINKHEIQVVFKRSKVQITRKIIESCPSLLAVQLCCIGDDSIDKPACAENGIMIFNDPISNGRSVVELVIGTIISLARRLFETNESCRTGAWEKNNIDRDEIQGKVFGVIGLGNIGRAVARAAENLGMKINFYDTRQVSIELGKEMGWKHFDNLEAIFRASDCVTVHLSARDIKGSSNEGILDSLHLESLGADRPKGPRIFINYARGFVHTPETLVKAIESGAIRKAAVDVYPHEPRRGDSWSNPYQGHPDVVVLPHIGASTQEAQPRIAARVAETFGKFSQFGFVRDTPFKVRTQLALREQFEKGQSILIVCHSTARGTKRAIDEAIYQANVSNLSSVHKDFNELGFAYDLALLDGHLDEDEIALLIRRAEELTGEEKVIFSVRQVFI